MLPPIAKVPPNLIESVSSLVVGASILRKVLTEVVREMIAHDPKGELPSVLRENQDELALAEIVIACWREHLGLDDADAANSAAGPPNGRKRK
jgi:hypothetical protein